MWVAYMPPCPPKDAVDGHLCMVSPDLCTYQSLMPTRRAILVHFFKCGLPWWIRLQSSGLACLCQAELLAWLHSMNCRTRSVTAWVELLLPSQLKASSFDSVCWCPANHKPILRVLITLLSYCQSNSWAICEEKMWAGLRTTHEILEGKQCMWC